jgi:thermitase
MDDTGGWLADAVACVTWCTAQGAVMSTNSWGGGSYSRALENAIKQAAAKSSFFVVAAGNDGLNLDAIPDYPASYKTINMVSVAASAPSDALAPWSNFGRATVDLAAPGVDILSTVPGGGYDTWSGTSMATPHATGTLALMRAACAASRRVATCPLSMAELRAALLRAVDPVASPTVTGGRLNASKAVAAVALAAPGAPSSPLPPAVTCAAFNARCGASSLTRAACCPGRACRYANRVYTCR